MKKPQRYMSLFSDLDRKTLSSIDIVDIEKWELVNKKIILYFKSKPFSCTYYFDSFLLASLVEMKICRLKNQWDSFIRKTV